MAAFDRIRSGLPQVDKILDHIRIGDNVVWQVTEMSEFRYFAELIARQAVREGRRVIYIRFAQHDPVLKDLTGIIVKEFNPDDGFETFTVGIHEEITRQGKEAFYIFDCLSELQSVWYTDLMMGNFLNVLEYFGQSPFIVRSSSFLEDGFGNAFAGKYESVFCVNQGSPEKRLEAFEQAVRTVYASTMDYSALEYRSRRKLDKKDEQMAILVQRVSGTYYGNYFMPGVAGVGYSHSTYQWCSNMDPKAGMLRLVMGLGTKAVDRTKEDYPRVCNLDRPTVTMMTTSEQKHKL